MHERMNINPSFASYVLEFNSCSKHRTSANYFCMYLVECYNRLRMYSDQSKARSITRKQLGKKSDKHSSQFLVL